MLPDTLQVQSAVPWMSQLHIRSSLAFHHWRRRLGHTAEVPQRSLILCDSKSTLFSCTKRPSGKACMQTQIWIYGACNNQVATPDIKTQALEPQSLEYHWQINFRIGLNLASMGKLQHIRWSYGVLCMLWETNVLPQADRWSYFNSDLYLKVGNQMQALGLWHTSKLVAWYPTSSKVPLCQYMIYGTDHSASMINWLWWSCNKLVITFVRGLYIIILALALRPAALGLNANIWRIALALVQ